MAISVTISGSGIASDSRTFPDATGFHIDEPGRLHVTKTSHGNIATFHPGAWLYAEKLSETEPAVAGVTIKVACPVCNGRLEYQHEESEAWGIIPLEGQGCAEITINDHTDTIRAHLAGHQKDGTWRAAFEKRLKFQAERAAKLLATTK